MVVVGGATVCCGGGAVSAPPLCCCVVAVDGCWPLGLGEVVVFPEVVEGVVNCS